MSESSIVGRQCGRCSFCCKLFDLPQLGKPAGAWCRHCSVGHGCSIYPDRPSVCRAFLCCYMTDASLGEHWYPAYCHMVLSVDQGGRRLCVYVDPAREDAWRREPHHAALRDMAGRLQVVVAIGTRRVVVLPDRDFDAGICGEDETVSCVPQRTSVGIEWRIVREKKVDPSQR